MHRHSYTTRSGEKKTTWREKVREGPPGARRSRDVTAPTRAELRAKLTELGCDERTREQRAAGHELLSAFLARRLEQIRPTVSPGTHATYAREVRLYILPYLGHLEVGRLLPSDVDEMLSGLLSRGFAPRTVDHCRAVLRVMLSGLVKDDVIRRNTASDSKPVRVRRKTPKTWSLQQVQQFLGWLANPPQTDEWPARVTSRMALQEEAFCTLGLLRGLREGELLGLQWSRLDLAGGRLQIDCSLKDVGGRLVLASTKSEDGERTISLQPHCIEALERHRARQQIRRMAIGPRWHDHDLVFPNSFGGPRQDSDCRKRFDRLVKASGLPRITIHGMRHTCATLLLEQGASPKLVQELLGHADIAITLRTYSHVRPEVERGAALLLESRVFGKAKSGGKIENGGNHGGNPAQAADNVQ